MAPFKAMVASVVPAAKAAAAMPRTTKPMWLTDEYATRRLKSFCPYEPNAPKTIAAVARKAARNALKRVQVGESGYIYAMTGAGDLAVHIAREGENIFNEQDDDGNFFIREMCRKARNARPGDREGSVVAHQPRTCQVKVTPSAIAPFP